MGYLLLRKRYLSNQSLLFHIMHLSGRHEDWWVLAELTLPDQPGTHRPTVGTHDLEAAPPTTSARRHPLHRYYPLRRPRHLPGMM